MLLTKHKTTNGSLWAVDSHFLPPSFNLSTLLEMPREKMFQALKTLSNTEPAIGEEEVPIDPYQEVWAAGVTYLRSRDARKAESTVAGMYQKVYEAGRPEIFSKSKILFANAFSVLSPPSIIENKRTNLLSLSSHINLLTGPKNSLSCCLSQVGKKILSTRGS